MKERVHIYTQEVEEIKNRSLYLIIKVWKILKHNICINDSMSRKKKNWISISLYSLYV